MENPNPVPFHFVPSTPEPVLPSFTTETVVKDEKGESILVQDESWVENFLNLLNRQVISDDSIIRMLRQKWNGKSLTKGRNNTAMSYAGILCKAGVKQEEAKAFIEELIPDFDITEIIEYAYTHNIFGCERKRYKSKNEVVSEKEAVRRLRSEMSVAYLNRMSCRFYNFLKPKPLNIVGVFIQRICLVARIGIHTTVNIGKKDKYLYVINYKGR